MPVGFEFEKQIASRQPGKVVFVDVFLRQAVLQIAESRVMNGA